ncbi:MAG: TatD family hydrolase [bacterium]
MDLVDTHCHIQSIDNADDSISKIWNKDPEISSESVIKDAVSAKVTKMICVGTDVDDSQVAVSFVADKEGCYASVGIHPHEAKRYIENIDAKEKFEKLLSHEKVVAIGECGLDYFYEHSDKKSQETLLRFQLDMAVKYSLPVIFHVREAYDDFWPIIADYPEIKGVVHSFTDNVQNVNKAVEHGFFIGVNGISTFTKEADQIDAYKAIPLSNLLLETDSPFLTPKPFRGTINQPKMVSVVADFLSDLRNEDRAELAKQTTKNAHTIFNI